MLGRIFIIISIMTTLTQQSLAAGRNRLQLTELVHTNYDQIETSSVKQRDAYKKLLNISLTHNECWAEGVKRTASYMKNSTFQQKAMKLFGHIKSTGYDKYQKRVYRPQAKVVSRGAFTKIIIGSPGIVAITISKLNRKGCHINPLRQVLKQLDGQIKYVKNKMKSVAAVESIISMSDSNTSQNQGTEIYNGNRNNGETMAPAPQVTIGKVTIIE